MALIERLTEEEISFMECFYNPVSLSECLFSDFDNLSEDDEENLIASYLEVFFILSWYPTNN